MPRVSVVVPVFNSEAYLRECIDSILSQSYRDFELILVDDGSRDNSGRIIDEYASRDSRIIVVHKENGGPAAARNAGLALASGDYVYFPDSDDILHPSLLETVIPDLENGCDMVVFGFGIVPPPNRRTRRNMAYSVREKRELLLDTDEKRYRFLTGPFRRRAIRWEVWNRVFRRDIIERWNIRFGGGSRIFAEDMYFTTFCVAHSRRIMLLPDRLYTYRKHDGSESSQYKKHLMIYSSNLMTELFREHCGACEDCRYLYEHFGPEYYLLHKGAIRRLRRHQWKNGLSMERAREILKDNVVDYPGFIRKMTETYGSPVVRESYRKDRDKLLQLTDRLYTAELLEIPTPEAVLKTRKALLSILQKMENRRQ